jgi:hypothetical protein
MSAVITNASIRPSSCTSCATSMPRVAFHACIIQMAAWELHAAIHTKSVTIVGEDYPSLANFSIILLLALSHAPPSFRVNGTSIDDVCVYADSMLGDAVTAAAVAASSALPLPSE